MESNNAAQVLEAKIVKHCAPVLTGIKPASMFSCPLKSAQCCGNSACTSLKLVDFFLAYGDCKNRLSRLGVEMTILDQRERSALVFVYRPSHLLRTISSKESAEFLKTLGYDASDVNKSLNILAQRIDVANPSSGRRRTCSFPHEIGVFLGYPVEDVIGFMENQGDNYLVCGCWKAYSNASDAITCFCRFEECTQDLVCRHEAGTRIDELVVPERFEAA